ncbi:hydroxylamine reductase [Clostridium chrysemydis]|uniref:hydroxylamine reductase n=1 Tax=Clostridium chrysemydis TaxID=2665504 RepID=UPI001883D5D2|nr:hydroxylamine reductase [Clostridium chrysemydis]
MENEMFCYQCEQTVGGKGCTRVGVCGKSPVIAAFQDMIIYEVKGIGIIGKSILDRGGFIEDIYIKAIEDSLFMTLTNVNFDFKEHIKCLKGLNKLKLKLLDDTSDLEDNREEVTYELSESVDEILNYSKRASIMFNDSLDQDIRSLRQTILYGLKGVAAYSHQARFLNYRDVEVDKFYFEALEGITDPKKSVDDLIELTLKTGEISVKVMRLLDKANTESFNNPKPTKVNVKIKKGHFIIVSGHDLKDLEMLLKQTEGTGINIYTHGEMLPAHGYPELKKYKHLVGNFGSAWQNQQEEFDGLEGCILMTTNCLMKPRESYKDRIFSTSVVGYEGIEHIKTREDSTKDFSCIIEKALELPGFLEDEEVKEITVGFARNATLENAEKIIELINSGDIRHFFLIGGCDGARPGRNYYTELAEKVPKDCVILTLACGKYRFNKLNFGEIKGIPRLLDVGQCNDAYSALRIAMTLADAFEVDINDLPLSIVLSWYEQKAVCDLLALLYLGVKDILLGPSLPAFLSPNVLDFLIKTFNLKPISTADEDLKMMLK